MADKKITELPFITDITASVGSSPSNTTVIPVVLYGTTNQITADNLKENFIRNLRGTVKDIQTYTSSLKGAVTVRGNGIEVAGNLEVQGNMSVKGTLYTQYETSSIIYTSGSTKFGNSFDDLHETTGSVFFTGSHTINGQDYTYYSSSNSAVFTNFSSSNSTAITAFSSSNSTLFTTYSSSNSTLFTNFSSSNSSYNTTFSSSNATYVTALSSSNSTYNTNLSSSNSTLFTNFSSSNSTYNTNLSSSNSTLFTNFSSSNSTLFTNFSSSNSSYNTTFSSSNSTTFTNFSSSNSTTFTNYSSSTANTIAGLSSGVSSELARVYQTTSSLNIFTGSQDSRNFVISQFTSSTDAHIVGISAFTSSQLAVNLGNAIFTSSARIELNSIEAYTASLKTAALVSSSTQIQNYDVFALNSRLYTGTGSLQAQLNGLMAFTAALDNTYATDAQLFQLYQATRSLELLSGSLIGITNGLMGVSASARIELNSIEAYTASLKAVGIVSSSTQITNYYKFAETASANTFYGNQTFNNDVRANKFVFTDGVINTNVGGQYVIATSGNVTYLYTGTSGLNINDATNGNINVSISNVGAVQTRGKLTVGSPGNDQDIAFGGSNSKLDWAATGAQIGYSVGALQFSSVGTTNNMILQQQAGALFNAGITGSLMATNGVVSSSQQIQDYNKFALTASANTFWGTQTFSGSLNLSGSMQQTGLSTLIGNTVLSGSIAMSGSTTQIGNNTIVGNTVMSGSIEVSGSSNFHNSLFIVTGSSFFTGSHTITGNSTFSGSINIASGSHYYRAGNKLFNYGQWGSLEIQSGSANTAYAMKLGTKFNGSEGITIANNASGFPTRITVENTGLYNIEFSTQLTNTNNTNITFDIWFAYTGSNIANSNTQIDVNKSAGQLGRSVAAWNLLTPIQANDYVELMWSCDAATGQLYSMGTQTSPARPAVPSSIVTITQHA